MSDKPNHSGDDDEGRPEHYLRQWREYMNWSQEELGDKVGVHQSKIQRIESGKRGLKAGFLRDLAQIFGVPPSALLEVDPSTEDGAQTASMLLAWNSLTNSQRGDVLKMVRALAGGNGKPKAG